MLIENRHKLEFLKFYPIYKLVSDAATHLFMFEENMRFLGQRQRSLLFKASHSHIHSLPMIVFALQQQS